MKNLVSFPLSPIRGMSTFRDELDRLFDYAIRGIHESALGRWCPSVDVHEDGTHLVFTSELPGMKKDAIKIDVENNVLTISGEKKIESEEQTSNYHMVERSCGSFSRSFQLPATVDIETADASYADGILTVKFEKHSEVKGRKIEVR